MKFKNLKWLASCASFIPILVSAQATIQVETKPIHSLTDSLHIDLHVTPSDDTKDQPADLWVYLKKKNDDNTYTYTYATPDGACVDTSENCAPFIAGENIIKETIDVDDLLSDGQGISLSPDQAGKYSIHAVFTKKGEKPNNEVALLSTVGSAYTNITEKKNDRPNLVIFLADDLGYSDIAPFGGEVETPTLDTMASTGTLLTNFHTQASCSPTRSITLSGVDNHRNGLGTMDGKMLGVYLPPTDSYIVDNAINQYSHSERLPEDIVKVDQTVDEKTGKINNAVATSKKEAIGDYGVKNIGKEGYEGHLNQRVITIATVLKNAGYHTYMIGKWHLGENHGFRPYYRGFEKTFALLEGAGSNFDHIGFSPNFPYTHYTQQGEIAELPTPEQVKQTRIQADRLVLGNNSIDKVQDKYQVPEQFYSTRDYTDFMINSIDADRKADGERKPFFTYFAYQAPHAPLQAPTDLIEKYLPIYKQGWDVIRPQRFDKMVELKIIPAGLKLPERWSHFKKDPKGNVKEDDEGNPILVVPAWDDLSANEQAIYAKKMAIYAAMIEYMDYNMNRFMDYLKNIGEFDNTVFLFFGDNGADDQDRDTQPNYLKWYKETKDTLGINNCTQDDLDSSDDIKDNPCYQKMGLPKSLLTMPPGWAQVSATPHLAAKATMAEGGLRASAIISGLDIQAGVKSDVFMSALDVFPTFLEYAHVKHPVKKNIPRGTLVPYKDASFNPSFEYDRVCDDEGKNCNYYRDIYPLDGRPFRSVLNGSTDKAYGDKDPIIFELYGTVNRALYMGNWKILKLGDGDWFKDEAENQKWNLYDLKKDPRELEDVSAKHPEIYQEMIQKYDDHVLVTTDPNDTGDIPYIPANANQTNTRSRY
ncbi:sulfatase-like hydrolase/transferase [Candidatus Albibeggiatoa sp. nov. NOAA]|uniref:sulfatase-like hydrolase/transferase n=1 Tax=Candidatus Albibeggiatoa sp. nov. NOAA TaxID=3162724 RepID=UPI0032FA38FD|nr:sulfatase-like hydrolase/transferase [Thiotrichaceae bacterium]